MSAVTRAVALAVTAAVTLPVTGCGTLSMLPGLGGDTTFQVEGTDGGDIDALAVQTITDAYAFLDGKLPNGATLPVLPLMSYDTTNPQGRSFCEGGITDDQPNAFYCNADSGRMIAWDRGTLLPMVREKGGDLGVSLVLAHEMGHAADAAQAPDAVLPVLVSEQRADCVAGAYTRTRVEGQDGVDAEGVSRAISVMLFVSDDIERDGKPVAASDLEHGVAIERMFAFLVGYEKGATSCFTISVPDTTERRDRVHVAVDGRDADGRDMDWTPEAVGLVVGTTNTALGIDQEHMALLTSDECNADERPVAVCPNGYIATAPTRLTTYQDAVKAKTPSATGDGTSLAPLVNAVANGWLRDRGVNPRGDQAGLRAACVTGAVLQAMGAGTDDRLSIYLSAGDMDEALSEVIVNGYGAADIDGKVPADVVARVNAYLSGIYSVPGPGACVTAFPDVDGEK